VLGASGVIPDGPGKGDLSLAGTLDLNGFDETVNGLTGAGAVVGAGLLTVGGHHRPGGSPGAQSISGGIAYGAASRLEWEIAANTESGAGVAFDRVTAGGAATVAAGATIDIEPGGAGSAVDFSDPFWAEPRSWVALAAGSVSGAFALGAAGDDAGGRPAEAYGTFSLAHGPAEVRVEWAPAPPFQRWQADRFAGNWNNPAVAGEEADPDKDGLRNLCEYALALDPNVSDGQPSGAVDAGRLAVRFARNAGASDATIAVQGADSPGGPWEDLLRSVGGAPFTALAAGASATETGEGAVRSVVARDSVPFSDPSAPRRFLRVQVSR
jgi:hypothetical protein